MPGEFVEDERQGECDVLVLEAEVAVDDGPVAEPARCELDDDAIGGATAGSPLLPPRSCECPGKRAGRA